MKDQHELESNLKGRLDELKPVPPRDPKAASRARAQFLGQAVSAHELQRQKGWNSIFRKERYTMNVVLSALVIAGLLFGGSATVSAAQDDLPNEPLYEIKTWTEDLSLQLTDNQEALVTRLMELAQIRVQEMVQLSENGEVIPDQVQLRLEQHIQQALQACLNMDDPTMERTLLQIRDRLQEQDRVMEKLQLQTQDPLQLLTQTRTMLQQRLQLVEEGLLNQEMFRIRVENGFQYGQDEDFTPPAQNGNGQQTGQPTVEPNGPNTDPNGPNIDPNGPNLEPGGPNTDPGSPTADPTNDNDSGNGSGGDDSGGSNGNGSGGNGKP